jgi:alkylhydroperoxidase family enzyme
MSRIAPLEPPYVPELQAQFDRIMRGAPPLHLFRVMAGNARAWEKFRGGSLLDRGPLSLREREIVIDRTCALNGCEYEWGVHVAFFADRVGFTADQVTSLTHGAATDPCWTDAGERVLIEMVDALHDGNDLDDLLWARLGAEQVGATVLGAADAGCWSESEQALIRSVDALHRRATLSDAEFAALASHHDDAKILEIILLCGFYRTVSYLANALDMPLEANAARFPKQVINQGECDT